MSTRAKSIKQFCSDNQISVATFYRNKGRMPRVVKVGCQSRILDSDESVWEKQIQQEADNSDLQEAVCG